MDYLTLKYLHIVASTLLFGTGIGSAFYLLLATLSRDARVVSAVAAYVVAADWLFTATTVVIQPLTGYWLVSKAGFPWTAPWLQWSIGLYVLAVACWLPVVWIQMRLRTFSKAAMQAGSPLPPVYWRHFYAWVALGVPAFFAFLGIFYLMVAKPAALSWPV